MLEEIKNDINRALNNFYHLLAFLEFKKADREQDSYNYAYSLAQDTYQTIQRISEDLNDLTLDKIFLDDAHDIMKEIDDLGDPNAYQDLSKMGTDNFEDYNDEDDYDDKNTDQIKFEPIMVNETLDKNGQETENDFPIEFKSFRKPFFFIPNDSNKYYSRFEIGSINDSFGKVFEITRENNGIQYIKELHESIILDFVNLLNESDGYKKGQPIKVDLTKKKISIGFIDFEMENRLGDDMEVHSIEFLNALAYKYLNDEEYETCCKFYVFDINSRVLNQDYYTPGKPKNQLYTTIIERIIDKQKKQGQIDVKNIIINPEQESEIDEIMKHFREQDTKYQITDENRTEIAKRIIKISGLDDDNKTITAIKNGIAVKDNIIEKNFESVDEYRIFCENHQKKPSDIEIPLIDINSKDYAILTPEDLIKRRYKKYVVRTGECYMPVFSDNNYIITKSNGEYIHTDEYIKTISGFLTENSIQEFSKENVLPFEYHNKKNTMINTATYISACVFIMTGKAIMPTAIRSEISKLKSLQKDDPDIDALDHYKEFLKKSRCQTKLTENYAAKENGLSELTDEMVRALFNI